MLDKETINLPQIIEVLGDRPHGMNETVTEYLEELRTRSAAEEAEATEEAKEESEKEEIEAVKTKLEEDMETDDNKK